MTMGKVSIELLLYFVVLMMYQCSSETTLELSVNDALQNGIGRYVVATGQTVQLACKTRQFPMAEFWIRRGDSSDSLVRRTFTSPGMTTVTLDIVGETSSAGIYFCGLHRRVKRRDSATVSFQSESMIELTVLTLGDLPGCFSSLGQSGLPDEEADLVCTANDQTLTNEDILWRGLDTDTENYGSFNFYSTKIPVKNQPSQLSCGHLEIEEGSEVNWHDTCSLPPLTIFEHMELHIDPPEFQDRNKTLRFQCESNPPSSLIRWSIFGHDENIIDDWLTAKLDGDIAVNITQGFGRSVLEMSGSAVDTDGVHVIACSTTRVNYKIAISQFRDAINDEDTPTSKLKTTVQSAVTKTFPNPSSVCLDALSNSKGSSAGFVVVIILLIIVVIILVVMSVWLYQNHRRNLKNNNSARRTMSNHNERNVTMQGNATYQPLGVAPPIAPPAYADLDVGYATMSTPQLDDQHYMEPSLVVPKEACS